VYFVPDARFFAALAGVDRSSLFLPKNFAPSGTRDLDRGDSHEGDDESRSRHENVARSTPSS